MIEQQFIQQVELLEYMQYSNDLVPGFQQAIGFYYHPIRKQNEAVILQKESNEVRKISLDNSINSQEINVLRHSKTKYEWVDENLIPFERNTNQHIQKQVFDELNHYILLIRIDSKFDNFRDLLFIYFKPDASNFGLKSIENKLSTFQKAIIASLLLKSFEVFHNQRIRYSDENQILRNDNIRIGEQLSTIQQKYKVEEQDIRNKIEQYILDCLTQTSQRLNIHLSMSSEAREYIKKYNGNIAAIVNAAEQTVKMAYRIQLTPEGGILKIEDYHLRTYFDKEELVSVSTGIESIADSRYHNTIQYLNRLEMAAKKVQAQGYILTGSAVGQAMEKPISAAAISDALKKNRKKFQSMLTDFPNEWLTIRKSFKPIRNVMEA